MTITDEQLRRTKRWLERLRQTNDGFQMPIGVFEDSEGAFSQFHVGQHNGSRDRWMITRKLTLV